MSNPRLGPKDHPTEPSAELPNFTTAIEVNGDIKPAKQRTEPYRGEQDLAGSQGRESKTEKTEYVHTRVGMEGLALRDVCVPHGD